MIANTNDGTAHAPRLRSYLNLMALEGLPETTLAQIRDAGYDGVQFIEPLTKEQDEACRAAGLGRAGLGRVNEPVEAGAIAARLAGEGMECGTLHVGWGLEDGDDAARLIAAVLEASLRHRIPLYVETHRATIFQDMWRTVQFVRRFPDLRFNGDFSHWYTGQEMVYGGFERKLEFIRPVLDRVRFVHGRIGDPGCMQVDVGDGSSGGRPYVAHFRTLWTEGFRGFLRAAGAGDYILFVPELLSPRIYYGRGESNRWEQSLVLRRVAGECWREAQAAHARPAQRTGA